MTFSFSLPELLDLFGDAVRSVGGSASKPVTGIAALADAKPGDLSFLGNRKYRKDVARTEATVVLLPDDYEGAPKEGQVFVRAENPSFLLALVCDRIERKLLPMPEAGVHPSAVVAESATVAASARIGPLCVVEEGAFIGANCWLEGSVHVGRMAKIGDDCRLSPQTHVGAHCVLGERVRLQGGVIVGSDGFGFELVEGEHRKVPQIGNVVIGDDVEIGANSTIDRARFSQTRIGRGTKIDNLVQIAHNVVIGKHCLLAAQVGVSGSTRVGDYVVLAGQVGIGGHLEIGDRATLTAGTGVVKSVPAGTIMRGRPANNYMHENKILVCRRKLPDLFKRISDIEEQLGMGTS